MSIAEPAKIITPWANTGSKNPIPQNSNNATGAAGYDKGFPDITMTPPEAGGIPPAGQDFNGIFYEVTNILRYMQAGGQPTFDAALATAIGGYPKGAMVLGSDGVTLWQSKVDSNSTDPNTDPSGWGAFDIGLREDLSEPNGSDIVGFQQVGTGTVARTAEGKLRESVSVTDFFADGVSGAPVDPTGVIDSTRGIQAAIDYAASIGATVISPRNAQYKLSAGIIHNSLAQVDLCNSTLTFYGASGFAWKIILGKSDRPITTPLKNVWLRGHATLADGSINPDLGGLAISAQAQRIENVLVTGCIKGFDFQENAYVVHLEGCAAWYNDLAWNSNQDGYFNMGAGLSASNCLFAHNNKDVFNKLCEAQFFNCAFDRVVDRYVEDNITSDKGVHNSILLFDACRFEGGGNATINMFTNSGRMVFNDCLFLEPLTYLNLFANSGEITINGGYSRINSEFYTSANTPGATISVSGFRPIKEAGPGWKLSPSESGVYNGDIETGTTAGFTVTTGTPAALQATTAIPPHSGTYSLRMNGGGPNILQSHPIKIKGDAKRFMLSVYMQNRSPQTVSPVVKFFDALGNELSFVSSLLANNTTIWTMKNFFSIIPNSAVYARFYLDLGLAVTDYVYMDDFYVNQW